MENDIKTYSVSLKPEFLNRSECIKEAKRIIKNGLLDGMTELQIAQEIYFHALAYDFSAFRPLFAWVKTHADPVDMCSHGDYRLSRLLYTIAWFLTFKKGK